MNPVLQNNSQKTANDYFNQGNQSKQSEQYQEAVAAYEKAIELNPNFSWYYHNLAEVFIELEQWEKASNCFHKACEINPNSEWSFYQLGEVLVQQGQLEEAIAVFQTAIEINSGYAEFYSSLGEILWQAERLEEAEKTIQKAVELDPNSVKAYQYFWEVLAKQGKGDEGLVYLQKAVELNPGSWEIHQKLGEVWHSKRDLVAAEKQYRTVIKLNSDYHWGYYKLGVILREQGKVEEAIASLQKAVELEQSSAICYHYLGHSLSVLQRWDEAIECYGQAIELEPNSSIIYQHLAESLEYQQYWNGALDAYYNAIEIEPSLQEDKKIQERLSHLRKQCERSLDGYLDEVDGCLIRGWAWDSSQPNKALTLVIYGDDCEIMRIVADQPRADLKHSGIGTGNYGFAVRLPESTCKAAPLELMITVENSDYVLRDGKVEFEYNPNFIESFQGNCEPIFQDKVKGWAVNPKELTQKLNIYIYESYNFIVKVTADTYRRDLQNHLGGDGKYGFTCDIPPQLLDNQKHKLSLCFENSLIELKNSPLFIEEGYAEPILQESLKKIESNLNRVVILASELSQIY